MEQALHELQGAAQLMNAPPTSVTQEQRKQAENLLVQFKKSEKPYAICRHILDSGLGPFMEFMAASTLKEAVMREWSVLGDEQIDLLRDYLLGFAHSNRSAKYVTKQALHVVALVVKRSILTRDMSYLDTFVSNVCSLFSNPNTIHLGLETISALLNEFTVQDKSLSSYMSYQHNLDCKKAIEAGQLYKIFLIALELVDKLKQSGPVLENKQRWGQIMYILHAVLTWDFGFIVSKRIAQMSTLNIPVPNLMPGTKWAILKEERVISLLVELYGAFAVDREMQHYARLCIVQLGTLQGSVFADNEQKTVFLSRYVGAITKLIANAEQTSDEAHGLALAVRQLFWANNSQEIKLVECGLFQEFLTIFTKFSVKVLVTAAKEDESEDVVDVVLDVWQTLHQMAESLPPSHVSAALSLRLVESYVATHLAPPAGSRNDANDLQEIDVEVEEDDRVKYREQLEIVGSLARVNLASTLTRYTALLRERTWLLRKQAADPQEDNSPLFEDLHWLVLLIAYTLSDAPSELERVIPPAITQFFSPADQPVQTEQLINFISTDMGKCGGDPPTENIVVRAVFSLLELASVYQDLLTRGSCHSLSPQVFSSLMWGLTRVCSSYLMPNEADYEFIPQSLLHAFGEDSQSGIWLVGFLVEKVISGLVYLSGDQTAAEDSLTLVQSFAKNPRLAPVLMKDANFGKLVDRYTAGGLVLASSKANRALAAALTIAMSHIPTTEHQNFVDRVFGRVRDSTVELLLSDKVKQVANCPILSQQVLTALDTFHGVAAGIIHKIIDVVFTLVMPVLEGCVRLVRVSQHLQPITHSVLELFCAVADSGIIQMDNAQTTRLHETCYQLLKSYSSSVTGPCSLLVGAEEDKYDNILLCLELLSHLCSKDFFCFDEKPDDTASKLVLIGLDIIVPHIDIELLKYPKLSSEFFKLVTFICEVYPGKVVALPDSVVHHILTLLRLGLNNYNDDITFYIFNAVSALAAEAVNNEPFQKKLGIIVKHTLLLISGQELPAELYDSASGMVFAFICKCKGEYLSIVNEILMQQESAATKECLRAAFSSLVPNSTSLSRKDRGTFSKVFENFAVNVYGMCR